MLSLENFCFKILFFKKKSKVHWLLLKNIRLDFQRAKTRLYRTTLTKFLKSSKIIFRPHCAAEVHHHWRPPSFLQPSWADNLEIPILSGYMIHESGTDPNYPFRKASWTWSILRVLTPQRLCSAGGCSFVALLLYSLDTICVTWGPTYSSREAYSLSLIYGLFLEGISH